VKYKKITGVDILQADADFLNDTLGLTGLAQ